MFSHDVAAAMMVSQTSPVGVESLLFQYLCIATDHVNGKALNMVTLFRYFQEKLKKNSH